MERVWYPPDVKLWRVTSATNRRRYSWLQNQLVIAGYPPGTSISNDFILLSCPPKCHGIKHMALESNQAINNFVPRGNCAYENSTRKRNTTSATMQDVNDKCSSFDYAKSFLLTAKEIYVVIVWLKSNLR